MSNPKLTVDAWLTALESGTYRQGRCSLYHPQHKTFCCLGVACDLSKLGVWNDQGFYIIPDEKRPISDNSNLLPIVLANQLNLASVQGSFDFSSLYPSELYDKIKHNMRFPRTNYLSLAALNDAGASFSLIAEVIRARPKGLFKEPQTQPASSTPTSKENP